MRTKNFIVALFSTFVLLMSCNKDENENLYVPEITEDDMSASVKTDAAVEDLSSVVLEQLGELNLAARTAPTERQTPTCAVISVSPQAPYTPGQIITKTINFGTTGCAMPNNNLLKGKIIIKFTYQPKATSHTLTYSFENFSHNDIKVEGTRTITITRGVSTANPNDHLIFKIDLNLTVTLENGKILKITGVKTREIVEGQGTPELSDNVYQITGGWETVFPSGTVRIANITSPLVVKLSCPHIVKGIISYSKLDKPSATLDFGNGECNDKATLTINGVNYQITLRK
ncbi:hypothetical protein [Flavobacterium columnare]|uniref:Lipoprotein n=1 Tax=Flavobacterium columnare TaxID=996 RepID=A0AAI8CIZ7_9FLAO|nr:hypothetical protein [Flavobacterium columnare]AMO20904.1 hypothetical protein UN65_11695 [Flavobacterium columnare]MEB3801930.1 hypothetical protein [Flavobacterium columnare]QOG57982.1 hypothetical protein HUE29_11755 [Flavobacterium columnare]QOG60704.1 hypothetical protein HUE30_11755 [Flavobacterium columnare]QOG63424.1 hypothetical protein HUE31_11755 [Flavobacterium columnare]